jgi:hypothetical protein
MIPTFRFWKDDWFRNHCTGCLILPKLATHEAVWSLSFSSALFFSGLMASLSSDLTDFFDQIEEIGVELDNLIHWLSYPIGSMYGIYANIGGMLMVNVTIYSIHGSYGYVITFPVNLAKLRYLRFWKPHYGLTTCIYGLIR